MCFGNGGILCWKANRGDESFEKSDSPIVLLQPLFNHIVTKFTVFRQIKLILGCSLKTCLILQIEQLWWVVADGSEWRESQDGRQWQEMSGDGKRWQQQVAVKGLSKKTLGWKLILGCNLTTHLILQIEQDDRWLMALNGVKVKMEGDGKKCEPMVRDDSIE